MAIKYTGLKVRFDTVLQFSDQNHKILSKVAVNAHFNALKFKYTVLLNNSKIKGPEWKTNWQVFTPLRAKAILKDISC